MDAAFYGVVQVRMRVGVGWLGVKGAGLGGSDEKGFDFVLNLCRFHPGVLI